MKPHAFYVARFGACARGMNESQSKIGRWSSVSLELARTDMRIVHLSEMPGAWRRTLHHNETASRSLHLIFLPDDATNRENDGVPNS